MTRPDPHMWALTKLVEILEDVGLLPAQTQSESDRIRQRALARARAERSRPVDNPGD